MTSVMLETLSYKPNGNEEQYVLKGTVPLKNTLLHAFFPVAYFESSWFLFVSKAVG